MTDAARDALTGRDVRVVSHRQDRPLLPERGCPFCPGGKEAPDDYTTRWFVNRWPPLPDGRAEVVLFSPEHDASLGTLSTERVREVVDLWAERTTALGDRPDVAYVLLFENRGRPAGATIDHPHGQVYAFDFVPPAPAAELVAPSCMVCANVPEAFRVLDGATWTASVPALGVWPYELLLAPVAHIADIPSLDDTTRDELADTLRRVVATLDAHFDAAAPYMMWVHQRPTDGGDWPTAHLHVHVAPIWRDTDVQRYVASAEVGAGVYFNPVDPADAAHALRKALQP